MQVSVQQRQRGRSLGMVMKEKEEDLALFLELRKREKEKYNNLLLQNSDDYDGSIPGSSPMSKLVSSMPTRRTRADDFLNSENGKTDYDWLLTPPGTPLFPYLEMESQKTIMSQMGIPNAHPIASKSRLANSLLEHASRSDVTSRQASSTHVLNVSNAGNRRPSTATGLASTNCRSATPTGRPTLPAATKPSRPSTPTSRATLPSTTKPTAPALRSSTPTRSTARSSTPTARPAAPASKSTSRAATPTRRPSTPSSLPSVSAPPGRSSSVKMSAPTTSKNPVSSRGNSPSPIVKSKPWKPSELPGFSLDAPPNLRTSMPERPASASRGRPGAPSARSSSVEAGSNRRPRQQSCSPLRGRVPHGSAYSNGSSIPAMRRAHSNGSYNVSPVLIGTQMFERVINMRKLAPPKQDDNRSTHSNPVGQSSSYPDDLGFGRTLSKKSVDMATRHMDIRRSVNGNLRSLMTNIPASSMYSVRSGSTKSRTASASDSPLATSSNGSSEPSVDKNSSSFDGSEVEDNDLGCERGDSAFCQPA